MFEGKQKYFKESKKNCRNKNIRRKAKILVGKQKNMKESKNISWKVNIFAGELKYLKESKDVHRKKYIYLSKNI